MRTRILPGIALGLTLAVAPLAAQQPDSSKVEARTERQEVRHERRKPRRDPREVREGRREGDSTGVKEPRKEPRRERKHRHRDPRPPHVDGDRIREPQPDGERHDSAR